MPTHLNINDRQMAVIEDVANVTLYNARRICKNLHLEEMEGFLTNPLHLLEMEGIHLVDAAGLAAAASMDVMLTVLVSINNWRNWSTTSSAGTLRKLLRARSAARSSTKATGPALLAAWNRYFQALRREGLRI